MPGIQDLVECIVSVFVEVGGKTVQKGGMGIIGAAARKIGWASKKSANRGRGLGGHSISGHSMAQGFGRGRAEWSYKGYDPKAEYKTATRDAYDQARMCGSGCMRFRSPQKGQPSHLFGRTSFAAPVRGGPINKPPGQLPLKQKIGMK